MKPGMPYKFRAAGRGGQRGMATILIVLLVGLSLTATVIGAAAYLRNSQEQSLTAHAQLEAQLKAWSGVEVVRQYLQTLNEDAKLTDLASAIESSSGDGYGLTLAGLTDVTATFTAVNSTTKPNQFTAMVTGTASNGSRAQATSTIQVVYATAPASNPGTKNLNFGGTLRMDGNVKFNTSAGDKYSLNIAGDFISSSNSLSGVSYVNSTGSIEVSAGTQFDTLQANCDVSVSGSASSVAVKAMRNVCLGTSSSAGAKVTGTSTANGKIVSYLDTGNILKARGDDTSSLDSSCTASTSAASTSSATVCDVSGAGSNSVYIAKNGDSTTEVHSLTHVDYKGGELLRVDAMGNLNVQGSSPVIAGEIGGTLTKQASNGNVNVSVVANKAVSITAVSALTSGTSALDTSDFDEQANYAFTFDSSGFRKVTVRQVNGLATGTTAVEYYVGQNASSTSTKNGDWVCLTLAGSSTTALPVCANPIKKICRTSTSGVSCFAGSSAATSAARAQWKLKATTSTGVVGMAPGIAWFDGDITLDGGTFYNSFVVTGDITVSASIKVVAPNYAGYSGYGTEAPTGTCTNTFDSAGNDTNTNTLIPLQFCDTTALTYDEDASSGLGNYALLAGSQTTTSGSTTYVGGNITTGSTSTIYGNIKAGNELQTSSNTSIYGSIASLGLGTATANRNMLTGSTTINLTGLPSTLTIDDSSCSVCSVPASTKIKWTKYQ